MASIRVNVGASVDANVARMSEPFEAAQRRMTASVERWARQAKREIASEKAASIAASKAKETAAIASDKKREASAIAAGLYSRRVDKESALGHIAEQKKAVEGAIALDKSETLARKIEAGKRLDLDKSETLARKENRKRDAAEAARQHAQAAKAASGSGRRSFIADTARYAARRLLYSAAGYAVSLPGRLAAGFGVNPQDIGALVASSTARQSLSQDIANSGYIPGEKGANGKRQSAAEIMTQASSVARDTATDPSQALQGLQKFVEITGDLSTGRAVLGDMAKLTQATGSHMEDVVQGAAELSAKLGDIPNKAETINTLMRHLAGMGKLGAVEMRGFAKELASIAPMANQFAGNTQTNIGEMAVLLQEAKQHGGAKSADQAATAVRSFVATLSKGARDKQFSALGINPFSDKSKTRFKSAEEIITQSLVATKGDQSVLYGKLFTDERSKSAVRGFADIYTKAGGGNAGVAAVHAEFERLRQATMSLSDVNEAAALKMDTAAGRAQAFNLKIQDLVDKAMPELQKGVEQLGPSILASMPAFLGAVSMLTKGLAGLAFMLGITPDKEDVAGQASQSTAELNKKARDPKATITPQEFMHRQAVVNQLGEQIKRDEAAVKADEHPEHWYSLHATKGKTEDDKQKLASDQRELASAMAAIREFAQPGRIQDVRVTNPDEIKSKAGSSGASNSGPVAPAASGGQAPAARSHPYAGGGSFG